VKTLFIIKVKITRPYATVEDGKIRQDYTELFKESIQRVIKDELGSLDIPGLNVEVTIV